MLFSSGFFVADFFKAKLYFHAALLPITRFFIRNHFISNLVLNKVKFKKLLELHEKNLFISRLKTQSCVNRKISSFLLESSSNNGNWANWPLLGPLRLI